MKTGPKITLTVFILILLAVAAAGVGGTVYLYSSYSSMKADKAKAEADMRAAQTQREMLKIELDAAKEKLKNTTSGGGTSGPVNRHPLTGMTPVDIVKLTLTLKGEDVTKFAVKENSNDGKKAEVWVGPLNSEFGKAYVFAKQDGEWILYDIKAIGT